MFRFAQFATGRIGRGGHERGQFVTKCSAAAQFALTETVIFENRSGLDRRGKWRQNFSQFSSYLSQPPRYPKTSTRLVARNTKTPRSRASNPTASSSKQTRGSQRFTSPNCQKTFRNNFITTPEKPPRILLNRPPITLPIKTNRKKTDVNNRMSTQKTMRH